jgi:hypothetical protein
MVAYLYEHAFARANEFCNARGLSIEQQLGSGQDGLVLLTSEGTAIKSFRYQEQYVQELIVYQRLRDREVTTVAGFSVPQLRQFDAIQLVIEMTVVRPPFVVDFVAAYVDRPLPFDKRTLASVRKKQRLAFGDKWSQVQRVLTGFAVHGILLNDINPGNIMFVPD